MPEDRKHGRRDRRFPLRLDLRWRSLATKEDGEGQIINIGSTKILFTAGHEFAVGEKLRLSISWPVKLNCKYPLRLLTVGKVVHRQEDRTAVEIGRHEFRVGQGLESTLRKGHAGAAVRDWWAHSRRSSESPDASREEFPNSTPD